MNKVAPELQTDYRMTRILDRPNGYYWEFKDLSKEYGPFATLLDAITDMDAGDDTDYEPGDSLEEAETEIGIAGWIDPDTGVPAEESIARIEEH